MAENLIEPELIQNSKVAAINSEMQNIECEINKLIDSNVDYLTKKYEGLDVMVLPMARGNHIFLKAFLRE